MPQSQTMLHQKPHSSLALFPMSSLSTQTQKCRSPTLSPNPLTSSSNFFLFFPQHSRTPFLRPTPHSVHILSHSPLPSPRFQCLVARFSPPVASTHRVGRKNLRSSHLWQAVVAYEDRRFFRHFGIDPFGIGRAVFSFSARGGGSTITQQLVKNTFLKNERTFSRKVVEMLLALALERRISKLRILSSYLNKIYWGHGIYGVEMASKFYFGKHPAILSLGECAMLAGMIPAPELRSPLRNSCRGKTFQARVFKRMVEGGFLDIETALLVVKQSLHIRVDDVGHGSGLLLPSSSSGKGKGDKHSNRSAIWDWERESMMWEAVEDMERWVLNIQKKTKVERTSLKH